MTERRGTDDNLCLLCGSNPRWRQGEWCADCLYQTCCSRFPATFYGQWDGKLYRKDCVHGDAIRSSQKRVGGS